MRSSSPALHRRRVLGLAGGAATLGLLGACRSDPPPQAPWRHGLITVATGNTTGAFYQVGGGYADAITRHLAGYEGIVAPTAGSADNLLRLGAGDAEIALTFADVAADAVRGQGIFADGDRPLRALAAVYRGFTHLIVRGRIGSIRDLRGARVSTGTRNSGTEFLAQRILGAVGLDPDRDLRRVALSLPATTRALADGGIDAMFWSGALPTVGVTTLLREARSEVRFLPLDQVMPALERSHPDTYVAATIPGSVYQLPLDVPTIAVPNLLVVNEEMPEPLAYALTQLIFGHQAELAAAHPEWGALRPEVAARTAPVALHPGAQRYYERR